MLGGFGGLQWFRLFKGFMLEISMVSDLRVSVVWAVITSYLQARSSSLPLQRHSLGRRGVALRFRV